MSFLGELQRRSVFRVGIAYGITAWLLAQVADLALGAFGAPDWVLKVFLLALLLGFPVALVLAWALELTPEGLRRDSAVTYAGDSGDTPPVRTGKGLDRLIIGLLVCAVAWLAWDRYRDDEPAPGANPANVAGPAEDTTATPNIPAEPAVAVLPFVNMSEESGNEYFADGLSEELLNLLVQVPELRVAARTSSFSFKDKDATVEEIARVLGVDFVLEGSVRKADDRVRITAQLIEAEGGFHLWSETFDRRLDDIFAVQDEISAAVVDALRINLLGAPHPERTTNAEAYAAYLQGLHFFNQFSAEGRKKAEAKLEEALSLDPGYAPAVSLLANVYLFQANADERGFDAGFKLGRETAQRAIELDPGLAAPWGTLSYIQSYYDWDWDQAGATIERLREVDSNGALSLNFVANYLAMTGRFDDAVELRRQAIERDPLNLIFRVNQSFVLITTGDLAGAEEQLNTVLELKPGNVESLRQLANLRRLQGDPEAALRILGPLPESRSRTRLMATALDDLGRADEAQALMDERFEERAYGAPFHRALFHAARGESDLAFAELDEALKQRWRVLAYILSEPDLMGLRDDPRWVNVLERIGLDEYWRQVPRKYGGPGS